MIFTPNCSLSQILTHTAKKPIVGFSYASKFNEIQELSSSTYTCNLFSRALKLLRHIYIIIAPEITLTRRFQLTIFSDMAINYKEKPGLLLRVLKKTV